VNRAGIHGSSNGLDFRLSLAKITSAFIFIAFPQAQIGQPDEFLTVKTSELHFNFSAGWIFGEAQLLARSSGKKFAKMAVGSLISMGFDHFFVLSNVPM
jgi:hypothetical protein